MSKWAEITRRAGRNDYPFHLATNVLVEPVITDLDEIAAALKASWCSAEYPEKSVSADLWQMIFEMTGFVDDRGRVPNPVVDTITVYRGAITSRKARMSWTGSLDKAIWFADRFAGIEAHPRGVAAYMGVKRLQKCAVWELTVERDSVLAHFVDHGEDEWVVAMDDDVESMITELVRANII
jgi:hypothetical protein